MIIACIKKEAISKDRNLKRKVRKGFTRGTQGSRFEGFILCELCEKSLCLCVKKTFETASLGVF